MADTRGEADLRKEMIDATVKAVALATYKLKRLCTEENSSAWTETYFRETNTELAGGSTATATLNVKGIPQNAPFPYGEASWTKVSGLNYKYGMEGIITFEDELMSNISVISRTLLRIGRAPAYAVDKEIAAQMLANAGNTYAITAGFEWDSATYANRDPSSDINQAIDLIRKDNIDVLDGTGVLCVNGTDWTNMLNNSRVTNNPSFKVYSDVKEGFAGEINMLKIMVTEALEASTPDVAYVVKDKEAMTWKNVYPLTVEQIKEPGIKTIIRAFQLGQCQVVVPNAICKITNTRK